MELSINLSIYLSAAKQRYLQLLEEHHREKDRIRRERERLELQQLEQRAEKAKGRAGGAAAGAAERIRTRGAVIIYS